MEENRDKFKCLTCGIVVLIPKYKKINRCSCNSLDFEFIQYYPDELELRLFTGQFGESFNNEIENITKNLKFKTKTKSIFLQKFKVFLTFHNSRGIGEDEESIPEEYLSILKNSDLFNLITKDELDKKIVGETETRKVIFLCCQGRLVENCQVASYNLLVNDDAGAGKDYIVKSVLAIFPKESYIHKTRISPTVFTYWKPVDNWNGIIFYPEDISENVLNSDVFKVMASQGSSAVITIKNRAVEVEINGKPVMKTTTASAIPNPELTRRFVIANLDSSEEQTKLIMKRHSEFKKKGIIPEYDSKYTEAMKYLQRVKVKILFADLVDENFPSKNIVMRTNYPRFLDFIAASCAFHQFQRKRDDEGFLLAEKQDYEIARECFIKICSNKYMIALTRNQRKILEIFEKEKGLCCSPSQFEAIHKIMTLKNLIDNLDILVKYGLLESENRELGYRERTFYKLSKDYKPYDKIEIPIFDKLFERKVEEIAKIEKIEKDEKIERIDNMEQLSQVTQLSQENVNLSQNESFAGIKTTEETFYG